MAIEQLTIQQESLLLNFHKIDAQVLQGVWRVYFEQSLDKIILKFDHDSLSIEAVPDDDTITLQTISNTNLNLEDAIDGSLSEPWHNFIGQSFGWGWITINQQEAVDGVLLSFRGLVPQIILNVMASSIKVSKTQEITTDK